MVRSRLYSLFALLRDQLSRNTYFCAGALARAKCGGGPASRAEAYLALDFLVLLYLPARSRLRHRYSFSARGRRRHGQDKRT